MPGGMNGSTMGAEVASAIETLSPGMTDPQRAQLLNAWMLICNAIVRHIQTNAIVNPDTMAITPTMILDSNHAPCSGNGSVNVGTGKIL